MKKRIYKKWINRYITPLIKDLPRIDHYDREKHKWISLINGKDIPEGNVYQAEHDPMTAIKKTVRELKYIIGHYGWHNKIVYLRKKPEALIFDNNDWYRNIPRKKHPRLRFYGICLYLHVER